MQEHRDEERSRPFDLPMGGLLSELLASEGIDAGEFAAVETTSDNRFWPVSAQPAADPAPPPVMALEPDIVLPGLLHDLLNLAGAAETLPLPSLPPEPPAVPAPDPVRDLEELARTAENRTAASPGEPELPHLAIPGLLSLLSDDAEFADEAECAPGAQSASSALAGSESLPCQTADPDHAEVVLAERMHSVNAPVLDDLEIDGKSEPPEAGLHPPIEEPPAAEQAETIPATGQPEGVAADLINIPASAQLGGLAAGRPGITSDPAEAVQPAESPASADPELESEPEYSPADAAAALAEAAGQLVRAAVSGAGAPAPSTLAELMSAIGGASEARLDRQPATPPEACERYVVFQLGEQSYGLHITCVREVEKVGRVTSVPGAPPMIRGLINLHGEILPLVDPRPLLALPAGGAASGGYLVVVHRPGEQGAMAWLVDGLGGMALVDPAAQKRGQTVNQSAAGIVLGSADHRGRRLLLLDGRRLASEEAVEEAAEQWAVRLEESQK